MISYLFRRQLCYDISLHSDIELTKEVFPKINDKRIVQDSPVYDHISSYAFPEYPVITHQGTELILSEMEWSLDPVTRKTQSNGGSAAPRWPTYNPSVCSGIPGPTRIESGRTVVLYQ